MAECSGFSLQAGVAAKGGDREKFEHLARYIARPPLATERLALTDGGHIRDTRKTPYRDATTHILFRTPGLHRPAGRPGTEAAGTPDPLSRRIRTGERLAGPGRCQGPRRQHRPITADPAPTPIGR
ncbi:MAG: transposase [Gammaproteobacteria bacterium]|nr:transposase [Gammaproteobacteria bacterium]